MKGKVKPFSQRKPEGGMLVYEGYVKNVSPSYFINQVKKRTGETLSTLVSSTNVIRYTQLMLDGVKFEMPTIDNTSRDIDGLHRVLAAKKLGVKQIPVYIITSYRHVFGSM